MMKKVKPILPISNLKTLYSSFIHSHFNYGYQGGVLVTHKVYKLEKESGKIIYNNSS